MAAFIRSTIHSGFIGLPKSPRRGSPSRIPHRIGSGIAGDRIIKPQSPIDSSTYANCPAPTPNPPAILKPDARPLAAPAKGMCSGPEASPFFANRIASFETEAPPHPRSPVCCASLPKMRLKRPKPTPISMITKLAYKNRNPMQQMRRCAFALFFASKT